MFSFCLATVLCHKGVWYKGVTAPFSTQLHNSVLYIQLNFPVSTDQEVPESVFLCSGKIRIGNERRRKRCSAFM